MSYSTSRGLWIWYLSPAFIWAIPRVYAFSPKITFSTRDSNYTSCVQLPNPVSLSLIRLLVSQSGSPIFSCRTATFISTPKVIQQNLTFSFSQLPFPIPLLQFMVETSGILTPHSSTIKSLSSWHNLESIHPFPSLLRAFKILGTH